MGQARACRAKARIGVNDAGAIAFFSARQTFDVVGLTTAGEARYWSAGPGSRFEHYEHLTRAALPTHFIVYPEWFAIPSLLGDRLTERRVDGATILGGATMAAYIADYSSLGSGERAAAPVLGKASARLPRRRRSRERGRSRVRCSARHASRTWSPSNGIIIDGARRNRRRDQFRLAKIAPAARASSWRGSALTRP